MGMTFNNELFHYVRDLITDGLSYEEVLMHCASQYLTLESFRNTPEWTINGQHWDKVMRMCMEFYKRSEDWLRRWSEQGLIEID